MFSAYAASEKNFTSITNTATIRSVEKHAIIILILAIFSAVFRFKVDATSIRNTLNKYVFAQEYATLAISNRLHIAVADLNTETKHNLTSSFVC